MTDGKYHWPDGFIVSFFKHRWHFLLSKVLRIMEEYHSSRSILPNLNATFILLVPKEENVASLGNFFTISLCNVIYKLISKVVSNRMKHIIPCLITLEKIIFVKGCQILDVIILAHKTTNFLKTLKKPYMLLKLDLSKSFKKLNWSYIEILLFSFVLYDEWIHWVISLISSSLFSILVSCCPSKLFPPYHGIWQRDWLSPFLFTLMVEGLTWYMKASYNKCLLKRVCPSLWLPPNALTICGWHFSHEPHFGKRRKNNQRNSWAFL